MHTDITFLHTAEQHQHTFDALLKKHKPNIIIKHIVDTTLLEDAIQHGLTADLQKKVSALLKKESAESQLVVCSCSTLGDIAENTHFNNGKNAIRIDRAMADLAVNSGKNILVLAALESTLAPTASLMNSSQQRQNKQNNIDYCLVEDSWHYFLQGNTDAYLQTIADVIETKQSSYDCVVLAQASMAGATELLSEKRALILSSPEIGVNALVAQLIK